MSETATIPGHAGLAGAERRRRVASEPYHAAIDAPLERWMETALIGIPTFTPVGRGVARPGQGGVIFWHDRRLADRPTASLRAEGLNVGIGQPCSPDDGVCDTIERHGEARGLRRAMIEIRSDLAASRAGRRDSVERPAGALGGCAPAVPAV